MANMQAVATIGFLVTLGSEASIAMPPQEVPAEVKSCRAITNDKDRLKCFDGLFGATSKPQESQEAYAARHDPLPAASVEIEHSWEPKLRRLSAAAAHPAAGGLDSGADRPHLSARKACVLRISPASAPGQLGPAIASESDEPPERSSKLCDTHPRTSGA